MAGVSGVICYCDDCAEKKRIPKTIPRSNGQCHVCGRGGCECNTSSHPLVVIVKTGNK